VLHHFYSSFLLCNFTLELANGFKIVHLWRLVFQNLINLLKFCFVNVFLSLCDLKSLSDFQNQLLLFLLLHKFVMCLYLRWCKCSWIFHRLNMDTFMFQMTNNIIDLLAFFTFDFDFTSYIYPLDRIFFSLDLRMMKVRKDFHSILFLHIFYGELVFFLRLLNHFSLSGKLLFDYFIVMLVKVQNIL